MCVVTVVRGALIAVLLALSVSGQAGTGSISDLAFMAGKWVITRDADTIEEYWMAPSGKTMVAAFRRVQGGKLLTVELVMISEEADDVVLRFKHFGADFVPWEKDEPNVYRLDAVADERAVFRRISESARVPSFIVYERIRDELHFKGVSDPDAALTADDLLLTFSLEAR